MKIEKEQAAAIGGFLILGVLLIYGSFAFFAPEDPTAAHEPIRLNVPSVQQDKDAYESRLQAYKMERGEEPMSQPDLNLDQYFDIDSVAVNADSTGEVVQSISKPESIQTVSQPNKPIKKEAREEAETTILPPEPALQKRRRREKSLLAENSQASPVRAPNIASDILVAVHGNHEISPGEVLKLRVLEDVRNEEQTIHSGTILQGMTQLRGDRLLVTLSHIQTDKGLMSVALQAYDKGMAGIYIADPNQIAGEMEERAARGMKINVPILGSVSTDGLKRREKANTVFIPSSYKLTLIAQ